MMDLSDRHIATQQVMRFFVYDHLPPHLRGLSAMFADLAEQLVGLLDDDPQLTKGLDELWEAKNRFVALAAINGTRD